MITGLFFITASLLSALSYIETKNDGGMSRRGLRFLAVSMVASVVLPTAVMAVYS